MRSSTEYEYTCSECNNSVGANDKFCGHCGADLREEVYGEYDEVNFTPFEELLIRKNNPLGTSVLFILIWLANSDAKIDEKEYKLDVLDAGKSYFVIFADETSGNETYGGGRFLYVDKPDSTGKIFMDFNKAYNPPCVFTKYATCPLPPKQNHLKLEITAGEKNYGHDY